MAAMLAAAREHAFDILLVGYVSRWQRNLRRTLELLEDVLHPAGVAVYFCDEEILSSSERHWDQLVDEAKDAERYSRRLARRIREGYASKPAKQADPGGHPPFGFRRNEAKLIEPDPERVETVRRMFGLSSVGVPDRQVSELVGVPLFTVRGVLTSPLYVGLLRDGSKAHWQPVISAELWDAVTSMRAKRATNAGRPASPRRPYALDMLYCSACGKRLTGDTGFYRHHDACEGFQAATPEWPPKWKGRRDGKAYRRELFEEAVGVLLDRVSVNAAVVARVVATWCRRTTSQMSPHSEGLSRSGPRQQVECSRTATTTRACSARWSAWTVRRSRRASLASVKAYQRIGRSRTCKRSATPGDLRLGSQAGQWSRARCSSGWKPQDSVS
jgi:DNA invertase Pin-like site-specific DNA recombinase